MFRSLKQKRSACTIGGHKHNERPINPPAMLLCAAALGTLGLTACTTITEKARGWLASDADAFAVVDGRVLMGEARFYSERDGRVQVHGSDEPALSCFGPLRFNATTSGVVEFNCSNGRTATVYFQAMGPLSGAGRGLLDDSPAEATMSTGSKPKSEFVLTYGLPPAKAVGYLAVAADRLLPPKPAEAASAAGASNAAKASTQITTSTSTSTSTSTLAPAPSTTP